jgi:alpha-beta hydrolase superfamily lysophospholipase
MKLHEWMLAGVLCLVGGAACFAETHGLPAPDGTYGVGRTGFDWTDHSRKDTLGADPKKDRELMVYLWYPAKRPAAEPHAPYWPGVKAIDADAKLGPGMREDYGAVWPEILSGGVYAHVLENAPVVQGKNRFPVVVFSHGAGGSTFGYTALLEALVSHGYVVAAIEHPGTVSTVVFPDGRVLQPYSEPEPAGLTDEQRLQRMMDAAGRGIEVGTADERFVLDRLTALNDGKGSAEEKKFVLAGRLDLGRVAVAGHSAGADFAARACELEARFKACVALDGAMEPVVAYPEYPDKKPILHPLLYLEAYHDEAHMFGTHEQKAAFFKKKKEQLEACLKGSYDVVLSPKGMVHGSFSDWYVLSAKSAEERAQAVHNLGLVESYTLAFLDQRLKDKPAPLLEDAKAGQAEAAVTVLGR